MREKIDHIQVNEKEDGLIILDQTRLPLHKEYIELKTAEEMFQAIKLLQVRGAPAIGIFAAYAMAVLARSMPIGNKDEFIKEFMSVSSYLNSSRPTAVNLSWALKRMEKIVKDNVSADPEKILPLLMDEADSILAEDIAMCTAISEYGLTLLKDGDGILTHCNAGPIATSRYGTATGPLILGTERGRHFRAYADETRPLLQGARLTSYELYNAGVDVTLICDNMASSIMKAGLVQFCFVGCDRIAANGDTANKIGTSGVAILARHYGIPFYVLGPTSTIDPDCPDGNAIKIEERDPEEIRSSWYSEPMALSSIKCFNPAFDVTDNSLISGIITEKGILRPPYTESIQKILTR